MNILLYGGSFNPPHNGHIHLLRNVLGSLKTPIDKAFIIPAKVSPFKTEQSSFQVSGALRLEMCKSFPRRIGKTAVEVSDCEINRPGDVSYTYDTILYFLKEFRGSKIFLLMGNDTYENFNKWYKAEEILKLVRVCISVREKTVEFPAKKTDGVYFIPDENPVEISSSEIREKIKSGDSVLGMVPFEIFPIVTKIYANDDRYSDTI
ncbi:MAG: nicotinate (nicotinamide) nucleotide adenylyltransferase [Ruminococcus sp.]|jgi:nicotinate-nucleotide adenylyltransferase|nr:nicotinate (nicotinamide) nucleotide adenylyltransferase [Ruminococcus sp.]